MTRAWTVTLKTLTAKTLKDAIPSDPPFLTN
jgi:hypothetical protein